MLRYNHIFCVAIAVLYCFAEYVSGISYIDDVQLSYENDVWQCDRVTCKDDIYGCKVSIENNPLDKNELIRMSACYLKDGTVTRQLRQIQTMVKPKTILIDIDSYVDAESLFSSVYSINRQEMNGTIAPQEWQSIQETYKAGMEALED